MTGLLILLDMAGQTIAELQRRVAVLEAELASERADTPSTGEVAS